MDTKTPSLKITKSMSAVLICGVLVSLCIAISYTVDPQTYKTSATQRFVNSLLNNNYTHHSLTDEDNIPQVYSIDDINNQLFCPSTKENGYHELLRHIHSLQYPEDCYDPNNKFVIWQHQCNVGLFASLECIVSYFAMAIFMNRTFLLKGKWTFADEDVIKKYNCPGNSMDCYFLPVSSCDPDKILAHERQKEGNGSILTLTGATLRYYGQQEGKRKWMSYPVGTALPYLTQRILYIPVEFGWTRLNPNGILNAQLNQYYGLPKNNARRHFTAFIEAYLLRMNPSIRNIVNKIVLDSYMTKTNGSMYNMSESVSIMIRWGDKCKNKELADKRYPHPEMECYTYHEYMILIKTLKLIVPELKYVIVTCDSSEIITNITTDYKDWMDENGMIFVTNLGDVMQGSSVVDRFSSTDNVLIVLISLLSTMKVQFGSKYYLLQRGSFWNTGTFNLINKLNCAPLGLENDTIAFDIVPNTDRVDVYLSGNIGNRVVNVEDEKLKNKLKQKDIDFAQILNFISSDSKFDPA